MTLPPWRHHRSMLSKWLPLTARIVRVVPPAQRSPRQVTRDGAASGSARRPETRQSPVRPRAAQAGPAASARPAKRAHAAKQQQPTSAVRPAPPPAQQASPRPKALQVPAAVPQTAAVANAPGTGLRRASLLSKEIEDQRAPPPKAQQIGFLETATLCVNSNGTRSSAGGSSDGSTHGASAACPRIRTVKMRGGSSAGGSSGGRMPTSLVLPPVSTAA